MESLRLEESDRYNMVQKKLLNQISKLRNDKQMIENNFNTELETQINQVKIELNNEHEIEVLNQQETIKQLMSDKDTMELQISELNTQNALLENQIQS